MAKRADKSRGETLNAQQRQFCVEYVVDFNATQAAIRAGYSAKTAGQQGHALLKNPHVQTYLTAVINKRAQRTEITADWVLSSLVDVANRCKQAEPAYVDGAEGIWKFDSSGANRSLELIGKHLRMWVDRSEVVDVTSAKQFAENVLKIVMDEVHDPKTRDAIVARVEALCGA